MKGIHEKIAYEASKEYENLKYFRRDLHQHPEVSGNEVRTASKITEYLNRLKLEVKNNIGGNGIVAVLRGGKPGKTLLWRADIDAFADNNPDVVDFPSVYDGLRHICGHDVHAAIGVGLANVLNSVRKHLEGNIVFIFQPSEEDFTGADKMIKDGILDMYKPEAAFTLHVSPLPTDYIAVKSEEVYSVRKKIMIKLDREKCDQNIINESIESLKKLINVRDIESFEDVSNYGCPEIGLSSPNSIYKDYIIIYDDIKIEEQDETISIEGLFFSSSENIIQKALVSLRNDITSKKWNNIIKFVGFSYERPSVVNPPQLTNASTDIIRRIYSEKVILPLAGIIPYNHDDFAVFQEKLPGVYFFLGGADYEKGILSMPHSPKFAVDERCIEIGIKYFASMLYEYLKV